jgi:hypothetical protein
MQRGEREQTVLVHLASGVGNIVLATPLLIALHHLGFIVDVFLGVYPERSRRAQNRLREIQESAFAPDFPSPVISYMMW